jgi:peptidoglycan/xylan/chitin deacetylase (PgdA/CDA1 family)
MVKNHRRLLAFRLLALFDRLRPGRGVPIALYHQVVDTPVGYRIGGHVTPEAFRKQMHRLAQRGYRGISIREYVEQQRDSQPSLQKVVGITFDDGQEDVYTNAFPILRELGFSATIFVVTGYLSQEKWFDPKTGAWSDDQPHRRALFYRFMNLEQVREMHVAGLEFGAHTCTHPRLTDLPLREARSEVEASKATLEQALGKPVQTFCYPFGKFNREVRQIVIEAGFQAACCTIHGLNGRETDPFALRRYGIAPITGSAFDVYLTGKYAWYYRSSRRQRGKA